MKKSLAVAAALSACALSFPVRTMAAVENGGAPNFEFAFGFGAMKLDKDRTGIDDTGIGLNMGIRFGAETLPIGAEWRLYGGGFSLDDGEYSFSDGRNRQYDLYYEDCEYSIVGTDFSLLVNFDRKGPINPYVGAGFLYESATLEADIYDGHYHGHHRRYYHEDWDEDGATFLVRAGVDLRLNPVYVRFDASYIGEIYDTDDQGQFLLSGDLGVHLSPQIRFDCFGHYFTEYKSYYIGIGATLAL